MDQQLAGRRRTIERQRALFEADPAASAVDPVVGDSWRRCAPAVAAGQVAAPLDEATVPDRWDASPIRRAAPDLVDQLQAIARDGDLVAAITDEHGRILWSFGGRTMRTRAETVNFTNGGIWAEPSAGTNAVAMSLITQRPFTVFSAEHWCAGVQDWVCYAAPVLDAAGRPVGAIDLSSTWDRTNPLGQPTVAALARVVEQQLRHEARLAAAGTGRRRRSAPHRASPPWSAANLPRPSLLELDVMGRGAVRLDGQAVLLTPRQVEVLTVLACAGGLTLDELHTMLHGERPVSLTTTKVEVSRLRGALGEGVVGSRPYRLRVPVEVDLQRLMDRLGTGDLHGALALYKGQLLPRSDAPFIVERRHHCDVALRTGVLDTGSVGNLLAYADVHPWDLDVLEAAVDRAGAGHPLRATATARLAVALDDADGF